MPAANGSYASTNGIGRGVGATGLLNDDICHVASAFQVNGVNGVPLYYATGHFGPNRDHDRNLLVSVACDGAYTVSYGHRHHLTTSVAANAYGGYGLARGFSFRIHNDRRGFFGFISGFFVMAGFAGWDSLPFTECFVGPLYL